jgi:succinate dehydrogenase / fumarate reductase membrane anchor subunit
MANDLKTPLKRVRGLGSAKEGVQQWWLMRLTSVALIPLTLWFIYSVVTIGGQDYPHVAAWAAYPVNAFLIVLLTGIMVHHAAAGIQTVLEDYVHHEGRKLIAIYGVKAILYAGGAATILSILKLAFQR